jgi:EEF1A lysine methyltransferase 2
MESVSKLHWENIYSSKEENELGWYQPKAEISLNLIKKYLPDFSKSILDIGSGASVLIDNLLEEGFTNLMAADISNAALVKSRSRLGDKSSQVNWIVDDVVNPRVLNALSDISLWHDRAVFHFLLEDSQKQAYISLLNQLLEKDGIAIIATFRTGGAKKCSGLDICQYDHHSLAQLIGSNFVLLEYLNISHYNPKGEERPFIYTVFRKKI